ncbi:MAG: DEAD/DEAH box helicase, partial [Lachnospiraceae bacterium]|nr:DEAD/DEAH box helicase [Lachnospiraceae bacterium]
MELYDNITTIKGIGEKTAASFARLGIYTVKDLISTYPRNYLTYGEPVDIKDTAVGERCAIMAIVSSTVYSRKVRSLNITTMTVKDSTGSVQITWFNSPFLQKVFHKGETYVFVGTIKVKNNMRILEMPEYYKLAVYEGMRQEMQPIYPLTQGLSNKTFQKAVISCRETIYKMEDYLPDTVRYDNSLMEITEAYENVHFPMNETVLKNAIRRFAFDEFYKFLFDMGSLKAENVEQENSHIIVQGKAVADFIDKLPYKLTKGQAEAIDDILSDMGSDRIMNRLVQGDVGSGKTIVAITALYAAVKQGFQGALMVPTEVLAKQHFTELSKIFASYNISVACLVGSFSMKEKRQIYDRVSSGDVDILIGTHALIEDKVEFKDLGLVITDEQHRFGVNQRKKLASKGTFPHVLV